MMGLLIESHERGRGELIRCQNGTEYRGGSMPIAIPDVSSYAIGPRDMVMHTGYMLHGSSKKSGQRTLYFVAHTIMRKS